MQYDAMEKEPASHTSRRESAGETCDREDSHSAGRRSAVAAALFAQHAPRDLGIQPLALDAGLSLDRRAVFGRHAPALAPHARKTGGNTDARR